MRIYKLEVMLETPDGPGGSGGYTHIQTTFVGHYMYIADAFKMAHLQTGIPDGTQAYTFDEKNEVYKAYLSKGYLTTVHAIIKEIQVEEDI